MRLREGVKEGKGLTFIVVTKGPFSSVELDNTSAMFFETPLKAISFPFIPKTVLLGS
jgi:hypothetical protein